MAWSFYKRFGLGRFLTVNPSTGGLSVSIGVEGCRVVVPLIDFGRERHPMINAQKYGVRYRRFIYRTDHDLDAALASAEHDAAAAKKQYERLCRRLRTTEYDARLAEAKLGSGFCSPRKGDTAMLESLVSETPADYRAWRRLGSSYEGDYERFKEKALEIRK